MIIDHQLNLVAKRIGTSVDRVETVIFDYMSPNCDLDLEDDESFRMILWPMMMHHHTKFGYKSFGGSEHIVWTNTH